MEKYLFIAEKPSLMRAVRDVYNKYKKEINAEVGLIDFVALAGHVCRLIEPSEYTKWDVKWNDLELPMIPNPFKIDAIPDKKKIIKDIQDMIKKNSYDGIIVGTDADVEGNGIYYLLENYLNISKMKALRFFEQDQTDAGILKSFKELTDFHSYDRDINMTKSYLIRSHMDWLIGMNFTVGFSVKSGFTMKVGRVKAPTLKLVYDNCKAIDEFVPHTDYAVEANYDNPEEKYKFKGIYIDDNGKDVRFETEKKAEEFYKTLGNKATVTKIEKKNVKTPAPQLYKLSDVQAEAGKLFGLTPEKVTDIVQSLYEKKYVSYPRTSGRYISTEKAKEFPKLLKAIASFSDLKPYVDKISSADIEKVKKDKRIVNDVEVKKASHDALLPTGIIPDLSSLSKTELDICNLIYKRLLALFLPALQEEKTTVLTDIDGNTFKSNGKVIKDKGWTVLYKKKLEETEIPLLKKGDVLNVLSFNSVEKTTQPPSRLTQPTLIETMENIAKYIDDKDLKSVMKTAKGIGMESSRASIIKDLINSGYMESKGKAMSLYITDVGKKYIENLLGFSIVKPELTAEWEQKMQDIREGERTYEDVETEMIQYVKDMIREIDSSEIKKEPWKTKSSTGLICPVCGKPIMNGKYGYFCSGAKDGCKFSIQGEIAGKKLTDKQLKALIEKGKTGKISGFTSKTGKKFDAAISLAIEDGKAKTTFLFDNVDPENKHTKIVYKCPNCGGNIINDKWAWKCSNNCGFSLSYKIAGREMKEDDLKELIENGKTKKLSGFISKAGKHFSAAIILKDKTKTEFQFN